MDIEGYGEAALATLPELRDAETLVKDYHSYFPSQMDGSECDPYCLVKVESIGCKSSPNRSVLQRISLLLHDLFGKLTGRTVRGIFGIGERSRCNVHIRLE